ncbi:hypothetical protein [Pararhizobium sp. O133]|uniref:hypothetical protein n=1 Tax=Pararhizobium sp. O133 TaxID=3449278 RepID=UPI003F685ABD
MAKLTFSKYAPYDYSLWDEPESHTLSVSSDKKTLTIKYGSPTEGGVSKIVLKGTALSFKEGLVHGGTIASIDFLNASSKIMATYSELALRGFQFKMSDLFATTGIIHAGNDTITGSAQRDLIDPGAGNDIVKAGAEDDFITDYKGNDTYDGGAGNDQVDYSFGSRLGWEPYKAVIVDLRAGTATDPWGYKDKLISIEQARGTTLNDKFYGSDNANGDRFMGYAGNDYIDGRGGSQDQVSYKRDARHGGVDGVTVDLSKGIAIDGFGDTDTLKNIEWVEGGQYNDKITGNSKSNFLVGFTGNDTIKGNGGDDWMAGEGGNDKLYGLNGSDDVFVFRGIGGSLGSDQIFAFKDGEDKILFNAATGVDNKADLKLTQSGDDVVIKYAMGTITVDNITVAKLTTADFIFE